MKKIITLTSITSITSITFIAFMFLFACKKNTTDATETYNIGKLTISVDESLLPIAEEQEMVFESEYKQAKITLQPQAETEIINNIIDGKTEAAILATELSENNIAAIRQTKRNVIVTPFCTDAIALIVNKNNNINTLTISEIEKLLSEQNNSKQLIFDNANSSTLSYLLKKLNVKKTSKLITSQNNNLEVIKFVAQNDNSIGFVGVNWLQNQNETTTKIIENVKVLAVGKSTENAVKPTQTNLFDDKYPFTRKINLLNLQGRDGLGMGFAYFITAERGQRIVLKSGLLPVNIPTRAIEIINK